MQAALRLYKEFIDALVKIGESVHARRVREGVWHRQPPKEQVKYNQLLKKLPQADRDLIADIVQKAADSAIHDVLVMMTDQDYHMSKGRTRLAVEPFDNTSFQDFVARREGWAWPDEKGE